MEENRLIEIIERLAKIEGMIESSNGKTELEIRNLEEKLKVANHRIDDLENTIKWLNRAIAGTVITALIGGAIAFFIFKK